MAYIALKSLEECDKMRKIYCGP